MSAAATFSLLELATRQWRQWHASTPAQAWWVPGRIELLGKHTDYAGGRSLLCAVERGIVALAAARQDDAVHIWDAVRREGFSFGTGATPAQPAWAVYPAVVAQRLAQDFPGCNRGADVVFASNLPAAAGMSSSSALMIAAFLSLASVSPRGGARPSIVLEQLGGREQWAAYVAAVEGGKPWRREEAPGPLDSAGGRWNSATAGGGFDARVSGVGTHGGSEDHTAILCCQPDTWSQFRFCPVRHEADYAAPRDMQLVIGVSGVVAQKTGAARGAYNRASRLGGAVLEAVNAASGRADATLSAACAAGPEAVRAALRQARHAEFSALEMETRFEQFWLESEVLIPAAGAALAAADWQALGEIVARSQRAAEEALRNQVPETVALVALARRHGAAAASAFGAGFGGAVWALTPAVEAATFRAAWEHAYRAQFPQHAPASEFFLTTAAAAATRLR